MRQVVDGVPVFGSDVVVHGATDAIRSMNGNVTAGLHGFDVKPVLANDIAMSAAKHDYVGDGKGTFAFDRESTELVVLPQSTERAPRLARHLLHGAPAGKDRDSGTTSSTRKTARSSRSSTARHAVGGERPGRQRGVTGPGTRTSTSSSRAPTTSWTRRVPDHEPEDGTVGSPARSLTSAAQPITSGHRRRARLRRDHAEDAEGLARATTRSTTRASRSSAACTTHQLRERLLGRHADDLRRRRRHAVLPASPARSTSWRTRSTTASRRSTRT